MTQNTAVSFSVCIDNDQRKQEALLVDLKENYKVITDDDLELVTVRHYRKRDAIQKMKDSKIILLESYLRQTAQLVVKDLPIMERIG